VEKLDLIIRDKQAELLALHAELTEALTGLESPDYGWAARIQPLIYAVQFEIDRLEELSTLGLDHRPRRQAMLVQGAGVEPGPVRGFYPTHGRHNVRATIEPLEAGTSALSICIARKYYRPVFLE
jgi:hypothetical protein